MSFVIFKNGTATKECGISKEDLKDKPFFRDVLNKFLFWIDDMVKLAKKTRGKSFVPGKMPVYRIVTDIQKFYQQNLFIFFRRFFVFLLVVYHLYGQSGGFSF